MRTPFDSLIADAARRHGVPGDLVHAIVQVESSGNTFAYNPEPHYRYFWDVRLQRPFRVVMPAEIAAKYPPRDFPCYAGDPDQEWWGQQASWGLMQLMGAVARERGFKGPYLPELTVAEVNLEFGCAHLAHLARRFLASYGMSGVIAAYNTGGPSHAYGSAGAAYVRKAFAAGAPSAWAG